MFSRERYFTKGHGVDDAACHRIIQKAIEIEGRLGNVSRIVFVAHGLQNDGWLERQYGYDGAKRLKKGGVKLPGSQVFAKFDSLKTYNSVSGEIVVTLGLESDDILKIDDAFEISAILALPWTENSVDKWAQITNAINIDNDQPANSFVNPDPIVIKALGHLSESINMSTGLRNSGDDHLAKTYLRALYKYKFDLNEDQIESYLIKNLDWSKEHSEHLLDIIRKINTGRSFHGGSKTGLKSYIDLWRKECQ